MFLEISQNSQENICARASLLIKLQSWGQQLWLSYRYFPVIWEISKNTFSYRKPLVAASENWNCFGRSSFEYNRLFGDSQITWNIVQHALNSCWRYKYNRDLIWFALNCFFLTLYWDSGTIPFEHCTLL